MRIEFWQVHFALVFYHKEAEMGSGFICYFENERRKQCPKCGSTNFAYESEHWDRRRKQWADVYIVCRDCGHRTHTYKNVEEAREEWNGGRQT